MNHRIRNGIIGGTLGLGVGIAIALLYDQYTDGRLKRVIIEMDSDLRLGGGSYLPQYIIQSSLGGLPAADREDRYQYRQRL